MKGLQPPGPPFLLPMVWSWIHELTLAICKIFGGSNQLEKKLSFSIDNARLV